MHKKLLLLLYLTTLSVFSQEKFEVFFDFDKYEINQNAIAKLNIWMTKSADIEVIKIYGYCDWIGTNTYNDTLSLKRVQTILDYLR